MAQNQEKNKKEEKKILSPQFELDKKEFFTLLDGLVFDIEEKILSFIKPYKTVHLFEITRHCFDKIFNKLHSPKWEEYLTFYETFNDMGGVILENLGKNKRIKERIRSLLSEFKKRYNFTPINEIDLDNEIFFYDFFYSFCHQLIETTVKTLINKGNIQGKLFNLQLVKGDI